MSKKNQKLVTPAILRQAVIGSFTKLNPVYMMKNPVMFVVEIGFFITLVLSFFPGLLGDVSSGTNLRAYNISKNRSGKKSPFPILRITLHGNSCCNFCATFALGRRLRRSPALELKKMRIASISFFAILRFPSRISGRHLAGI